MKKNSPLQKCEQRWQRSNSSPYRSVFALWEQSRRSIREARCGARGLHLLGLAICISIYRVRVAQLLICWRFDGGEIQDLFHNLGEVAVELGYDPSKKWGSEWRRAMITYGKIRIEKPSFWSGKDDLPEESLKLLPRHARLQNMTYSSLIKVEDRVQIMDLKQNIRNMSVISHVDHDITVHVK